MRITESELRSIIRSAIIETVVVESDDDEEVDIETRKLMSSISGIDLSDMHIETKLTSFIEGSWASSFEYIVVKSRSDSSSFYSFIFKDVVEKDKESYRELFDYGPEEIMYRVWQDLTIKE